MDLKKIVYNAGAATQHCQAVGGKLPEPIDYYENNFLNSMGGKSFFLGVNDNEEERRWVYNSDSSPSFSNWFKEPPRRTTKNCAYMMRDDLTQNRNRRSRWKNVECSGRVQRTTVCEKISPGKYLLFQNKPAPRCCLYNPEFLAYHTVLFRDSYFTNENEDLKISD